MLTQNNTFIKKIPVHTLKQILRIFRFTTRIYEQIQVEYYSRLAKGSQLLTDTPDLQVAELSPVFVLSTGRCGTKTLAALADLLPEADAHHEPEPKLVEDSYLYYMKYCELPENFWHGILANNRDEMIRQAFRSHKVYFEANNRLALLSPLLLERYPEARFIHLVRHPYDFVHSAMRRRYYSHHVWDFARIVPNKSDTFRDKWSDASHIEKCAWLWTRTNSYILETCNKIPENRLLTIKSEDIFDNVGDTVNRIFHFISPNTKKLKTKRIDKLLGMKLNQQTHGNFPKPKEWRSEKTAVLLTHCSSLMKKFGYKI